MLEIYDTCRLCSAPISVRGNYRMVYVENHRIIYVCTNCAEDMAYKCYLPIPLGELFHAEHAWLPIPYLYL